ncbi:hypothetical protein ZIOFF_072657 [Zingiber officinale]|uniref:Uncharacterized protein n=1 Tax=Zingiber officinale TaxID=94328 RepID=A0A8J5ESC5_ZINOF|nr:hypothetical protein ZIOFF_072657 [Zingiber officinale]
MVVWSSLDFFLRTSFLPPVAFSPSHGAMCHQRVKAIVINGQRKILISGFIHYHRSTLEVTLFEGLSRQSRSWDCMSTSELDLMSALSGILGFLVWLKYVSGINFRIDNKPFKFQRALLVGFVACLASLYLNALYMLYTDGYARSKSKTFGIVGHAYLNWAAQMVVRLGTGVPWVMCKEDDAPDPVN